MSMKLSDSELKKMKVVLSNREMDDSVELLKLIQNGPQIIDELLSLRNGGKPRVLTFGDLETGDKFISFPVDGDNSGHGGYLGTHYIFMKLLGSVDGDNSVKMNGTLSTMPDGMSVIKVE